MISEQICLFFNKEFYSFWVMLTSKILLPTTLVWGAPVSWRNDWILGYLLGNAKLCLNWLPNFCFHNEEFHWSHMQSTWYCQALIFVFQSDKCDMVFHCGFPDIFLVHSISYSHKPLLFLFLKIILVIFTQWIIF